MFTQNTNLVKIGSGVYRLATEIYTDIGLKHTFSKWNRVLGLGNPKIDIFNEIDLSVSSIISLYYITLLLCEQLSSKKKRTKKNIC